MYNHDCKDVAEACGVSAKRMREIKEYLTKYNCSNTSRLIHAIEIACTDKLECAVVALTINSDMLAMLSMFPGKTAELPENSGYDHENDNTLNAVGVTEERFQEIATKVIEELNGKRQCRSTLVEAIEKITDSKREASLMAVIAAEGINRDREEE